MSAVETSRSDPIRKTGHEAIAITFAPLVTHPNSGSCCIFIYLLIRLSSRRPSSRIALLIYIYSSMYNSLRIVEALTPEGNEQPREKSAPSCVSWPSAAQRNEDVVAGTQPSRRPVLHSGTRVSVQFSGRLVEFRGKRVTVCLVSTA